MGSVPQALKNMGNATPYAYKKMGSLQRQQNSFWYSWNIHYVYVTMNRYGQLYTKIPYTVNTVYIEYKSVVTRSHSLTLGFF